ncbi:MAG: serine/threonine protein kinase [Planctomycetes bacterium]|nr:serine/threonine protein kinase [Planctomycetota bacterium]
MSTSLDRPVSRRSDERSERLGSAVAERAPAAARPTASQLLRRIEKYELLPSAEVEALRAEFAGGEDAGGGELADRLVNAGRLTRWQADRVLANRPVLLGRYRLLDRIGAGGMGVVLKALEAGAQHPVAVKVLSRAQVQRPDARDRFFREIRAAARLDHPTIVRAWDSDCIHGTPFLAMEFVDGIDLAALVRRGGPLEIGLACELCRQVCVGLQHAHERGLVHRDIKPSNLLLTTLGPPTPRPPLVRGGTGESAGDRAESGLPLVKILDFGMARFTSETSESGDLTRSDQVFGTVDFMAPEQAESARRADIRSDLFSVGCTLFYLLTGQVPFPGNTVMEKLAARLKGGPVPIRKLRPDVPAALASVIGRMLSGDPARRYQTPVEASRALEAFSVLSSLPVASAATPPCPPLLRGGMRGSDGDVEPISPSEVALEQFLYRLFPGDSESTRQVQPETPLWNRSDWFLLAAALLAAVGVALWLLSRS